MALKGFQMKLPKFEKKHLIGSTVLVVIALTAFVLGTRRAPAPVETERKPASASHGHETPTEHEATSPDEDSHYQEEEIDIQVAASSAHAKPDSRGTFTKIVDTYGKAIESVNDKVQTIQRLDEDNKKLKMENAYLRVMVESQKFSCRADEAKKKTETVGKKLATAAGSKAARSLASIRYQYPENLLPDQLHALGVSYFKVKDDEKAAVILNFLTELEDDKSFKTAPNYLMAGVSFYRLDNFKMAQDYFNKIENLTESDEDTVKAKRQASYWKALVADRMKDHRTAQKMILENLEKDPHTNEARWVNPTAAKGRMPASHPPKDKESHEHKTESHH